MKLTASQKSMVESYVRSVVGAAIATYAATQDWKAALNSLWAAAVPVAMRYFNPKDAAFGKGSDK